MKIHPLIGVLVVSCACTVPAHAQDEDGFRPLFNGRNLDGWQQVNTAPSTWTVNDNMLICSGKPIGEIRTTRMYQNFILELEWRHMVPKGNAGVFIWADDITAKGQPFHRGIEVQVLENSYGNTRGYTTHGDIFPIHGATMKPVNGRGGSRAFPTENRSKPSPEWNHYRIVCQDGEISLAVNGAVVTRGTECNPRKGYICLESEGGIVHYRNIRIKELPETPVDDSMVAIADRGYECLYSGVDLSGWTTSSASQAHWKVNDWVLSWDGTESEDADALRSTKEFGDVGFIVDFRLNDQSGPCDLHLRGARVITLDRGNSKQNELLAQGRGWNRIEGTLIGDRLNLTLNGTRLIEDRVVADVSASGALAIKPSGPIDFANIYVRDASKASKQKP